VVHILLDLVTYGIWELPGSIYELRSEHRQGHVGVVYGSDDHVLEIQDYQAIQVQPVNADELRTSKELVAAFWDAVNK
jgi:hypothetical protein